MIGPLVFNQNLNGKMYLDFLENAFNKQDGVSPHYVLPVSESF